MTQPDLSPDRPPISPATPAPAAAGRTPDDGPADDLNWNQLRIFAAIVAHGGVTAAARALGISQPAVSLTLQRLETRLDQPLVWRDGRPFALTPMGEAIHAEALSMSRAAERALQRVRHAQAELTIRLVSNVSLPLLDEAIRLFHQRHPETRLRILIDNSQRIVAQLRESGRGIGVCLLNAPLPDLDCKVLKRQEWSVFCGVEHPFFGRPHVPLAELQGEPFVAFHCATEGNGLEPMLRLSSRLGLGRRISGTSAHVGEIRRMIVAGVGLGLLPLSAVKEQVAAGQLWPIRATDEPLGANLWAVIARNTPDSAEQDFAALIDELMPLFPDHG